MTNGIVEIFGRIGLAVILTSIPQIGVWGIWGTTGLTWLIACVFVLGRYKNDVCMEKSLVGESVAL
jgi:Na+-driven multidrug efflux pump